MFVELPSNKKYLVDESGNIWSLKYKDCRDVKHKTDHAGYKEVQIYTDGKRKICKVHRLVMEAWYVPSDLDVNHINGDKGDNRLENLEYVTPKQNAEHAWKLGLKTALKGERHGMCKLSDEQLAELISLKGKMLQREAAAKFGITQAHISRIWLGGHRALAVAVPCKITVEY